MPNTQLEILGISGIAKLKAVRDDKIVIQPWFYSVDGLENMANKLLSTK